MKINEYLIKAKNGILDESTIKEMLGSFGVKVPKGVLVENYPQKINLKYPLVLKVSDPEVLHKSDVGGVRLGIKNSMELRKEFKAMKNRFPDSKFIIETMEKEGLEIIVGAINDRDFGLAIMLGMGGIYTELYGDVAFRLIPIDGLDAEEMIGSVSINRFVEGFRGIKVNKEKLKNLLLKISEIAYNIGERLNQLDLNPVIATEDDLVVVDAKLSLK